MSETKKWIPELQSFSGLAIIFVVLIHSTSYYLLNILCKSSFEEVSFSSRLVDNFIHAAVPIYIFISGYKYILNDVDKSYKYILKSRVKRVFKPFFIISIIFFVKDMISNNGTIDTLILCRNFMRIFIGYNTAYQLWYVPMYFLISLTYPMLYKIIKSDYIRLIFILSVVIIQYSLSWYIDLLDEHPFDFIYYYIYFHMGVVFYKYDIKSKIKNWDNFFIYIFIIITIISTFNTNYYLAGPLKRFILWPVSVAAYYFLVLRIKNNRFLMYLGKYSFYIYLIHEPIFCTQISYIFKLMGMYNSIVQSFVICAITISVTLIICKIIENTVIKKLLF